MVDKGVLFGFDISQIGQNDGERCFEMVKAEKYKSLAPSTSMYWIFDDETCPEMLMAIRKAKHELNHLWPICSPDQNVAELIFQIVGLEHEIKVLREENAKLYDQVHGVTPDPLAHNSLDQLMTSVNDISVSMVCDETMTPTNYFRPLPGVNTILACGEKSRIDKDQSTALTAKVCQGIDQIAQMFYDNDSVQQSCDNETLNMGDQAMGLSDPNSYPPSKTSAGLCSSGLQIWKKESSAQLNIHKDLQPPEIPLGNRPGGLKICKEESEKPLGLQIFKDPEGVAGRSEFQRPLAARAALGGIQRSPPKTQYQQPIGDENLVPRYLHNDFNQLNLTGSRIDLVPCCASTAVFQVPKPAVLPSPIAPISSSGTNRISPPTIKPKVDTQLDVVAPIQPAPQQFKQQSDENDMDMGNSGNESPNRPVSPLAAAFNQFVHSPDKSGRLRIDATKFMEAFLTKKNKNPSSSANERKWPQLF
ncbi:unnamed protein product [Rodentolepis nana]|uniref:RUN domain-containing protein n=1 Tax=Rodentolepis nana TaxID=102285 RepID=A0A0R3TVC4_RODNA|nr:unnamed protein product [Rodentolepis nana]